LQRISNIRAFESQKPLSKEQTEDLLTEKNKFHKKVSILHQVEKAEKILGPISTVPEYQRIKSLYLNKMEQIFRELD
jgi:hypothetical protein